MAFFNFIETFFFISLGITFVLIVLLMYHFKQRIVNVEQKQDRMFEIINNIVKEMTNTKQTINFLKQSVVGNEQHMTMNPVYYSHDNTNHILTPIREENTTVGTDENNENYEEDDDINTENDDLDETDNEDNDDDDVATDNDDDLDDNEDDADDADDNDDDDDMDVDEEPENEGVNENDGELEEYTDELKIDTIEFSTAPITIHHEEQNEVIEEEPIELRCCNIVPNETMELLESENIHVNKLNIVMDVETETAEPDDFPVKEKKHDQQHDVIRKMNITQLKALVLSKGLATDTSKMKKPELIKLLENSENDD